MNDIKELKRKHEGNLKNLWEIYTNDKKFYNNIFFIASLIISVFFFIIVFFSKTTSYDVIVKIASLSTDILPNLLGFNLGAFILVVGFSSFEILIKLTTPLEKQSGYSLYQKLIAVLGISIIFQIFTLLFAFLISAITSLNFNIFNSEIILCSICLTKLFNSIILFLIIFFNIYSILILISVVKQIFIFAQTIHLFTIIEKSKHDNK